MEADRPLFYCATSNPGKVREYARAAALLDTRLRIEMLPGIAKIEAPAETGETFLANAVLKAVYYSQFTQEFVFADDSGLCVDCLAGEPGVYSARYSGTNATESQNIDLLLSRMAGRQDRRAHFVCVVAIAHQGILLGTVDGRADGLVLEERRGSQGFGYDPIFFYPPVGRTFAQTSEAEKLDVSHRGKALRRLFGEWLPAAVRI